MNLKSNWIKHALCHADKQSQRWLSYKSSDVEYAKEICSRCKVRKECFINAFQKDSFVGVIAGMSEYDFLLKTWHAIQEENESNWPGHNRSFQILLQETE